MLTNMRDKIRWHERDATASPRVKVALWLHVPRAGFGIWTNNEVQAFLYEAGLNPFRADGIDAVLEGVGMEQGSFEPEHERPNISLSAL